MPPHPATGAPSQLSASPHQNLKPSALIRFHPSDFVVEEIPVYSPSGKGAHLFVRVRKTDLTTLECVRRIARALSVDEHDIGFAGMKDRHAVTTQTVSVPFPEQRDTALVLGLKLEGIEVLEAVRHEHKLRIGHLLGNRFEIVLRRHRAEERAGAGTGPGCCGANRCAQRFRTPEVRARWG